MVEVDMGSGRYRVGSRIGGGGMAEVLAGELLGAEGFSRPVAIKRMLPALSQAESFGRMFVNEARIASLLHHANIAAVLDFDRDDDGTYYLVMELVSGVDLRELSDSGRLPVPVSAYIVAEMLRGLAYAHELVHDGKHLGIVHRDVSPHNVLISWSGAVKVADFGIAKAVAATGASRDGSLKGKVAYMSPEQAHGTSLDGRADLFAVGVILHELLTGRRLFSGSTEAETLARLLNQPIPRPRELVGDVPRDLEEVTMQLLHRDRNGRFLSASLALEAVLACTSSSARASLDLRELLATRFAGRMPPSADLSGATVALHAKAAAPAPALHGKAAAPTPALHGKAAATTPVKHQGEDAFAATIQASLREEAAPRPATPGSSLPGGWAGIAPVPKGSGETVTAVESAAQVRRNPRRGGVSRLVPAGIAAVLASAAVAAVVMVGNGASGLDPGGAARIPGTSVDGRAHPDPLSRMRSGAGHEGSPGTTAGSPPVTASGSPGTTVASPPGTTAGSPPVTASGSPGTTEGSPPVSADASLPPSRSADTAGRGARAVGSITVKVSPWAEVWLDGKLLGITPQTIKSTTGSHRIRLRNPDLGRSEETRVRVQAGRVTTLRRNWRDKP